MDLSRLKRHAGNVLAGCIVWAVFFMLVSGGEALTFVLLSGGVIGGIALQMLVLATVADATVRTLNKEKNNADHN